MTIKKILNDDSGLTVAVETILLFSISILLFGMIFMTFQGLTQKQDKILMEEELQKIGNTIARKMSDMEAEAGASNTMGSSTKIKMELQIPDRIGDSSYTIKMLQGVPDKIILESTDNPYVRVEVPVHDEIRLTDNSMIYSMDEEHSIEYDSLSGSMYFANGGVRPLHDTNAPTLRFDDPPEGSHISNSTYIYMTASDDVGVTWVNFYINDLLRFSASYPYDWLWDTQGDVDGDYKVTAKAYDAAGNFKIAERNFTIENLYPNPPAVSEISPPDLSFTDFKKPIISAKISDNNTLNISSIILKVDDVKVNASIEFKVPFKVAVISYTPLLNLENGTHRVNLSLSDLNPAVAAVNANWSFDVTNISDSDSPTVSILNPIGNVSLVSGAYINITYRAMDWDSGLENLTINIRRGDGEWYNFSEQLAIYGEPVKHDTYPTTQIFSYKYVGGMNYTYNITVFDRNGNSNNLSIGPFTVISSQADELDVDISNVFTTGNGKYVKKINIMDAISNNIIPVITDMRVSWTGSGGSQKIKNVTFNGVNEWVGNAGSGNKLDINPDHTALNISEQMELGFGFDIRGKTLTIIFYLADGTAVKIEVYPV